MIFCMLHFSWDLCFFYLAASRRAKECVSHFSFSTVILRFGTILYEQAFIFKRALGAVVS